MRPRADLTGQTFGRLTALAPARDKRGAVAWSVRCACGVEKVVRADHLRAGRVVSCGCHAREKARGRRTHGATERPEYRVWQTMIERCHKPESKAYPFYGARGITVCPQWQTSFEAFIADVGWRPAPDLQIDRIDNARGYEPGNVKWSTRKENCRNRRDTVFLTIDGETKPLMDWADVALVKRGTFYARILRGWDPAVALTAPAGTQFNPRGNWKTGATCAPSEGVGGRTRHSRGESTAAREFPHTKAA